MTQSVLRQVWQYIFDVVLRYSRTCCIGYLVAPFHNDASASLCNFVMQANISNTFGMETTETPEAKSEHVVELYVRAGRDGRSIGGCPQCHRVAMVLAVKASSSDGDQRPSMCFAVTPVNLARPTPDSFRKVRRCMENNASRYGRMLGQVAPTPVKTQSSLKAYQCSVAVPDSSQCCPSNLNIRGFDYC